MAIQHITNDNILTVIESFHERGLILMHSSDGDEVTATRRNDAEHVVFVFRMQYQPLTDKVTFGMSIEYRHPEAPNYDIYRRYLDLKNNEEEHGYVESQINIHLNETVKPKQIPDVALLQKADKTTRDWLSTPERSAVLELVYNGGDYGCDWGYQLRDLMLNVITANYLPMDLEPRIYATMVDVSNRHGHIGRRLGAIDAIYMQAIQTCNELGIKPHEYHEEIIRRTFADNPDLQQKFYKLSLEPKAVKPKNYI